MDDVRNDELVDDSLETEITSEDQTTEEAPKPLASLDLIAEHFEKNGVLSDDDLDTVADIAVKNLKAILECFGETDVEIDEYEGDEGELILDVSKGDLAVLIGRHGVVLDSLQLLVSSLTTKQLGFHYPVVVDIEGYKDRRKQKLASIAHNAAARAKRQQSSVRLNPMNAYERRLVHMALSADPEVDTLSEGDEPHRYVVVTLVK